MGLDDRIMEEIIASNDIVSVIGSYLSLRKTGQNHKACCPFHEEKTPSFVVSDKKQMFKCFGCGKGGNVVNFVSAMDMISYFEALKKLADQAGINIAFHKEDHLNIKVKQGLKEVYQAVLEVYHDDLVNPKSDLAEEVLRYAEDRVGEVALKRMQLGFSDPERKLFRYLKNDFNKELLLTDSRLFNEFSGHINPFFKSRLMIPIFDEYGDCIAFSARKPSSEDSKKEIPKYINSPENPLYTKSRTLYGFSRAKEAILSKGEVIIVEGYFDWASVAFKAELQNVVALGGTAFTNDHANLLKRYTNNIILCLDQDDAGRNATKKSAKVAMSQGLNVKIADFDEDSTDPDSILQDNGRYYFVGGIENSLDAFTSLGKQEFCTFKGKFEDFYHRHITNPDSGIYSLIISQKSPLLQLTYLRTLSKMIKDFFPFSEIPQNILEQGIYEDYSKYVDSNSKRIIKPSFSSMCIANF